MLVLTVHIWIVSELFAYAGVFAMTRENLGFIRQLTEMAQTVDDAEHAASWEIGSADRAVEEGVAGEGYVLCLAIEGDGTAAVAWSGDDLELVVAELDDLFVFEESANRRKLVIELHLIEGFCLLGESLHQVFISCRYFRFQSELLIDGVVAEVMVKMAMGYEQVNGLELVLLNILCNGRALFRIEGAAIDDDAFLGLIAHHVAVFLQHVYLKSFYM